MIWLQLVLGEETLTSTLCRLFHNPKPKSDSFQGGRGWRGFSGGGGGSPQMVGHLSWNCRSINKPCRKPGVLVISTKKGLNFLDESALSSGALVVMIPSALPICGFSVTVTTITQKATYLIHATHTTHATHATHATNKQTIWEKLKDKSDSGVRYSNAQTYHSLSSHDGA